MSDNKRKNRAFKAENRLRVALYYAFELLVDVFIVFAFVRAFSISYNFSHDVFYDSAKNIKNKDYVVVNIEPDSSTSDVAEKLFQAGVIKNKYVMMAKIKVSEAGSDIKAGKYGLSQAMTYNEIIGIITGGASVSEDLEKKDEPKVDTPTDATEIHDNSIFGAGDGGAEGDSYNPPDESGESIGDSNNGGGADSGAADGASESGE